MPSRACARLSPGTPADTQVTPSAANLSRPLRYASGLKSSSFGLPPSKFVNVMSSADQSLSAASQRRRRSSIALARSSLDVRDEVPAVWASCGGAGKGHQPSPYSATRCRAVVVLPPIQIGGGGVGKGGGGRVKPA